MYAKIETYTEYKKGKKMIVTLSGITGTGKSFFKDAISNELNIKNLTIITTRSKRKNEVDGIDKEFVDDEKFEQLKAEGEIAVDFEFLGSKYAYRKQYFQSQDNYVTEVHYDTIYEFKKNASEVFSVYIIPYDIERAKLELKKRELPEPVEKDRLKEIEEHIKEYSTNKELQEQFDYVLVNDYTEESKEKLFEIIKQQIK